MVAAFEIHRPAGDALLFYDSPHSGRYYPPDFRMGAPLPDMRRGEDAYVDELLVPSIAEGAVLLSNSYPRCYIDVNRAVTDLDPSQLNEPWPSALSPTEKSRRGLGLIRRLVVPGVKAQAGPLTVAEVRHRIDHVYVPYHAALDQLVAELRPRGSVVHINWHSMKSVGNAMTPDGPGAKRPDFIVSDCVSTTADPDLTTAIAEALRDQEYTVAINDPYVGGTIVKRLGDPAHGVHSVQIEINRALYLDEARVEKSDAFTQIADSLRQFTRHLASQPICRGRR